MRLALNGVLDVGDLPVDLILGRRYADDFDAVLLERVGDALHLQLRPVEVHGLHRDAHLELASLDLGDLIGRELQLVDRCRLLAVRSLADDRLRSERREIDVRAAFRRLGVAVHRRKGEGARREHQQGGAGSAFRLSSHWWSLMGNVSFCASIRGPHAMVKSAVSEAVSSFAFLVYRSSDSLSTQEILLLRPRVSPCPRGNVLFRFLDYSVFSACSVEIQACERHLFVKATAATMIAPLMTS